MKKTSGGEQDRGSRLTVRRFREDDAGFCFKVRSRAFIIEFYAELGPEAVAAGVNAYMPSDFVELATRQECFVVQSDDRPIGFFNLRREDLTRVEIPLIYLDLRCLGQGVGSWCMRFIEEWVRANWSEVTTLFLDTIIPEYNGGFYRKMGYREVGTTICRFPDSDVPAVRFEKQLLSGQSQEEAGDAP